MDFSIFRRQWKSFQSFKKNVTAKMASSNHQIPRPLLILVAGAKGAVGSTLAVTLAALQQNPQSVRSNLTTGHMFAYLGPLQQTYMAGWDIRTETLRTCIQSHGIVPSHHVEPYAAGLDRIAVVAAPSSKLMPQQTVDQLIQDIRYFRAQHLQARSVLINLLPACAAVDLSDCEDMTQAFEKVNSAQFPDLAYIYAAILSGIPVVNFTPNAVEYPPIIRAALKQKVPIAGRDGKTGQTYLKVVLASALQARHLMVDGWYSLNILGNADGINLMDPAKAAEKLKNKTELLDEILGYAVGEKYGTSTHKVHIDYYPPRGDAKEAWDVIDFSGLFGLPMSMRVNFLGRDSILAAPLALDLARWAAALNAVGRSGPIPELGFYFKKPVGDAPPLTFQDQVASLQGLREFCDKKIASAVRGDGV
jgi:myo-inositol-1-phosphate synthase